MEIVFTHSAFRHLKKLDKKIQKRIINKLKFFAAQKNPLQFAEPLRDHRFGNLGFESDIIGLFLMLRKKKL
jgi:mRNA-degrading endonuclease RelE of RelBE toxin-antitoxin system